MLLPNPTRQSLTRKNLSINLKPLPEPGKATVTTDPPARHGNGADAMQVKLSVTSRGNALVHEMMARRENRRS